jgi:uncharacterized protein (TIGR02145 family)/uncharacterized repeat protein (TIGR02543 family)
MDAAKTVTANFELIPSNYYTLTVNANPAACATALTSSGEHEEGANIPISATAATNCTFSGWTGTGIASPNSASTTVSMTENRSVTANFERIQPTLTVNSSPAAGGTVTGGGTFDEGTNAAIEATANSGYRFVGWTGDGIANHTSANTTVLMGGDKTVTANFEIVYDGPCGVNNWNEAECIGLFTDTRGSGKSYRTTRIGNQVWMADNLNWSGDDGNLGACYDNSPDSCAKYGRIYDWSTVMGLSSSCTSSSCASQVQSPHQGICPFGWHVPSDAEWDVLVKYVDPNASGNYDNVAGAKLRSVTGWHTVSGSIPGTDDFGFSALPGGYHTTAGSDTWGAVMFGGWWSATEDAAFGTWCRQMSSYDSYVGRQTWHKSGGLSLRCVR